MLVLILLACGGASGGSACDDVNAAYRYCGLSTTVDCANLPGGNPNDPTVRCVADVLWETCDAAQARAECDGATDTGYTYGYTYGY